MLQSSLQPLSDSPSSQVDSSQALNLTSSQWIWTNEALGSSASVPAGNRTFRKDFDATFLKFPSTAEVLIAADDGYTLYVNGVQAGTAEDITHAQYYCVDVSSFRNVVIALMLLTLMVLLVNYEIGDPDVFVTDSSWAFNLTVPAGFQNPSFDDSTGSRRLAKDLMVSHLGEHGYDKWYFGIWR
ncbi:hypothetical protein BDQ17DRAFT_1333253 [Cyathus striatus]|nr:hypothetical protein BDQ17DRAFT_1333253 [Cyathus striatus]